MRTPLRFLFPLLVLAAACTDRTTVTPPVTEPEPTPEPKVLGIYDFAIEGIGTDEIRASAVRVNDPSQTGQEVSASMSPVGDGLIIEQYNSTSVTEQRRGVQNGHRYISISYRIRNATAAPVNNVTFIPVIMSGTIPGTPFRQIRRFDNSPADSITYALGMVPTGHVILGDAFRMTSPLQDVLQVYTEAEVAAISKPANVLSLFPYGFVVRSITDPGSRLIPVSQHAQQYDGMTTFAFRIPLANDDPGTGNGETKDVYSFVVRTIAVEDTETRLTESIEESQDTAAVRRLRSRALALGATTVTVLAGSPAMRPDVSNYPGQRQICSVRTAGAPDSAVTLITARGAHSDFMILRPGESMDPCAPGFRTGVAERPATNVAFPVSVRAVDRYGNVIVGVRDTMRLETFSGPPATFSAPVVLSQGTATMSVTYSDYGNSVLVARGRRLLGTVNAIRIAGVTRTWTGASGTNWHTGGNWVGGAPPMHLDSVFIPFSAPQHPQLAANVSVLGVTVENGATITLGAFDLTAGSNVATGTSGGINSTVGRLILTGVGGTVHGVLPRMRVFGTYSLTGNVTTVAPLRVEAGRLRSGSFRVRSISQ